MDDITGGSGPHARSVAAPVPGRVRVVTDATFADVVLGSALPCLVEFRDGPHALPEDDWLSVFAARNAGLTCARLDVATSPLTARTYRVGPLPGHPTYLVFRFGAVVSTAAGADDVVGVLHAVVDGPTGAPADLL